MTARPSDAVIRFEPDGYDLNQARLLGRHVAGNSFLRAAVAGRGEGPVYGYTPFKSSAEHFQRMVHAMDPAADTACINAEQMEQIGPARGVIYLADPALTPNARLRLRVGPARHSLCGVTHTLASSGTLQQIGELLTEAVMPWDALVCTSAAALDTVNRVLEAQSDYLRWRFGPQVRLSAPQLPVIPLGVHCADFDFSDDDRSEARRALGLDDDEVAALYVGRLTFSGKAHPFPLFEGLQACAEQTGKRLVLIQCGQAPTKAIADAYATGAARFAPDVRVLDVDSRDDGLRRHAWAAGDIFVSLSDGIQETFGLTPLEAMAAGLPAVVTDWNGYRETVRDGVDGFRIATWAPAPGTAGEAYALRHEAGMLNYDAYCWAAAAVTSVEMPQLVERLVALIEQPDLRRSLGAAGKRRAKETFDWPVVFAQYRALWGELNARRLACADDTEELAWIDAAPRNAPSRMDPFATFDHYPTALISPETAVTLAPGASLAAFRERKAHTLFYGTTAPEPVVSAMWARLEAGGATIAELAAAARVSPGWAVATAAVLAKMGLVRLGASR